MHAIIHAIMHAIMFATLPSVSLGSSLLHALVGSDRKTEKHDEQKDLAGVTGRSLQIDHNSLE